MTFSVFPGIKSVVYCDRGYPAMLLMVLALSGCQGLAVSNPSLSPGVSVPTMAIRDLQTLSTQNQGVSLTGVVGDRVPLLNGTVYELQDSTGRIWILTSGRSPDKGQKITIQGTLRYKSIPLNGTDQGSIFVEQEHEGLTQ